MKKLFAVLIMAAMAIACAPAFAMAQEGAESPNHYGTVDLFSTFTPGEALKDSFYFSDDWFTESPSEANDALALVSMQAVASVIDADENGTGAAMLRKMGFDSIKFYNFDSDDPDDCAFVRAEKPLPSGGRLVAVIIQSYSMDSDMKVKGWSQNFEVNGDPIEPEHDAFAKAADSVYKILQKDTADIVTEYWVMGQSRGGAIANILATRLPKENTYAYTFEAPATTEASAIAETTETTSDATASVEYPYIHNYVCADDPVIMIPPWGMTRYGQTSSIDLALDIDEGLTKLQSAVGSVYRDGSEQETVEKLVDELEKVVKTRKDYSYPVTVYDGNGAIRTSNTYQNAMSNLMGALFGGGFEGLQTDGIMDRIPELHEPLSILAKAIKERNAGELEQSDRDFGIATEKLHDFLDKLLPDGRKNPLDQKDLFMVLKLVGDALIDESYEPSTSMDEDHDTAIREETIGMVSPLISLVDKKDALVYSHHFDTLIARLKAMSPSPQLETIDATMTPPAAGDSAEKAVGELTEAIDPSLSPEVSWAGEDSFLQDNKVYSLKVLLHVPGRAVDGFTMTINDQEPAKPLDVDYVDGEYIVKGVWVYPLGSPDPVAIAFDVDGKCLTPDSITVDKGSLLGIEASSLVPNLGVVHADGRAYKFEGWYLDETSWEDVVANGDLTLTASWKQVIDRVDISIEYPKVGEEPTAPNIPNDAEYRMASWEIFDEHYKNMAIAERKQYALNVEIESDEIPFLDERFDSDEIDDKYLGEIYVNGEQPDEISYYFDDFENKETVYVTCYFTPDYKKAPAARYLPLKLKSVKQSKKRITLTWKKSDKASSYVVYGALKSSKSMKKLATVQGSKYTVSKIGKKLKKGTFYKFSVEAKDAYGNTLFKTKPIYVATKGGKKGNYKSVQIKVNNKAKKKVTLKKGKTLKIKAKGVKPSKRTAIVKGVGIRYESSDVKIAKVSTKGVIKGIKRGTCTVYAYAPNGVAKTIKVTVK